jgi:hypothetical protein
MLLATVNGRSFEALSQERDNLIIGLLESLSHRGETKFASTERNMRLMARSRGPILQFKHGRIVITLPVTAESIDLAIKQPKYLWLFEESTNGPTQFQS